jgi:hypothetical protein
MEKMLKKVLLSVVEKKPNICIEIERTFIDIDVCIIEKIIMNLRFHYIQAKKLKLWQLTRILTFVIYIYI